MRRLGRRAKWDREPYPSRLAALIQEDIVRRGLGPRDRYLTAQEAAEVFGVSTMTANRALQELAARRILSRSQRRGTFVGENLKIERPVSLHCIHLFLPSEYFRWDKPFLDRMVAGLHSELPGDSIQLSFLPPQGELGFVRQLTEALRPTGTLGGAVLFLSSPEVQRYFRDSGLPCVVSGSVYPEAGGLPWVDRDQREVGRELARAAFRHGHQKIAILMRERWGFGDNLMIDGIHEAAGQAHVGYPALIVRSLPSDPELIAGALRPLLAGEARPTALLCRSPLAAEAAEEAARKMGLSVPKDLELFLADACPDPRRPCPHPHARARIDPEEHGRIVARMLKDLAQGRRPDPDHCQIPVSIEEAAPGVKT
jgi:DNA-binding LacI/PurR family transcriptional regulator